MLCCQIEHTHWSNSLIFRVVSVEVKRFRADSRSHSTHSRCHHRHIEIILTGVSISKCGNPIPNAIDWFERCALDGRGSRKVPDAVDHVCHALADVTAKSHWKLRRIIGARKHYFITVGQSILIWRQGHHVTLLVSLKRSSCTPTTTSLRSDSRIASLNTSLYAKQIT